MLDKVHFIQKSNDGGGVVIRIDNFPDNLEAYLQKLENNLSDFSKKQEEIQNALLNNEQITPPWGKITRIKV